MLVDLIRRTSSQTLRCMGTRVMPQWERRAIQTLQTLGNRAIFNNRPPLPPFLKPQASTNNLLKVIAPIINEPQEKLFPRDAQSLSLTIKLSENESREEVIVMPFRSEDSGKAFLIYDLTDQQLDVNELERVRKQIGIVLQKKQLDDALVLHGSQEVQMVVIKPDGTELQFCDKGSCAATSYLSEKYGNKHYLKWLTHFSNVDFY